MLSTTTKVSALSLTSKKRHGHKITMVTAYDYPSAIHVARASIDVLLVGDSVAMVELGHATTQPVTLDTMLHHCRAVQRGVEYAAANNTPPSSSTSSSGSSSSSNFQIPLLVADMPFGSYEYENTDMALANAYRFIKEAGMDAVKLEASTNKTNKKINRN
jgi:3-methyl-2-oxobutanoate hydroxymethyltransferase